MAWFPWSRPKATPPAPPEAGDVDLEALVARIQALAQGATEVDRELLEARLADHVRDRDGDPFPPEAFAKWSAGFEPIAWAQLGLLTELIGELDTSEDVYAYDALSAVLQRSTRLELELLATSRARAEEFARRLAHHLHLGIRGESAERSERALEKLDYEALLAMSEAGRAEAAQQMAKLQEQISRRVRRGKW